MPLSMNEVSVGDTFSATLVEGRTRTQIVQYAGASGDYNPLHTDEVFVTQAAGYPAVFAHGMLTMGMMGKLLTDVVGDGRLTNFGVRFANQVWPGDSLVGTAEVVAIRGDGEDHFVDLSLVTTNQHGSAVITGAASARIDGPT